VFNFLRKSRTWKNHFDDGIAYGTASDFEKAEKSFRQAIRVAPEQPYPHYELAFTLSLLGRHQEALDEFNETNRLSCGFFLTQTEAYLSRQLLSRAITPEIFAQFRLIQRLADTNAADSEQNFALCQQVVAAAPTCALGYFHLGKCLMKSNPAAAEEALQKCLRLGPDDTTAINAKFHLGLLKRDSGQGEIARRIWSGIVESYPGNPHIKFAEMMSGGRPAETPPQK
jgi:tetratricopeptide (TPR) repeat protein